MGTRFEITAMAEETKIAQSAVKEGIQEIQRIEKLISSWDANSQTSAINQNAGVRPVNVDLELFNLIERSLKISQLTKGAFDISFASIDHIYLFDKQEHNLPAEDQRSVSIQSINWQNVVLNRDEQSVLLKNKGMRIGFGGIGKGYAANRASKIMKEIVGVRSGIVNASGDIYAWGENGNTNGWSIQIANPEDPNLSIGQLYIKDASVVTSGDYEKYFMNNGSRYSHIIDPKTGLPTSGIKSATIICPDAELGDALATSLFVLGIEEGLALINRLKNVEALIISDDNEVFKSNNLVFDKYKI